MSVLGGASRPSSVLRKAPLVIGLGLLLSLAGCGQDEGVAEDATVSAYVDAPLCAGAKQELLSHKGRAGSLSVRAVCLPGATEDRKLNLATLGANARSATEDSTAVAYLEASDPKASRFTHPILKTAEIPWIASSSGKDAMAKLLEAIEDAGTSGSLRASLFDELG